VTTTLSDKIAAIEAFDATPAGRALKAYRDALQVTQFMRDADPRMDEAWKAVRAAERDLIGAIKGLQCEAADLRHDVELMARRDDDGAR